MKKFMMSAVLTLCTALLFSCSDKASNSVIVKGNSSRMDTLSYATGIDLAASLAREMSVLGFDYDAVRKAIETSSLTGKNLVVNGDTLNAETSVSCLQKFFSTEFPQRMRQKRDYEMAQGDSTVTEVAELDFNPETMFKSEEERSLISSAFGYDIGSNMVERNVPLHLVWVFKGWDDYNNNETKITEQESRNYIMEYFTVKVPAENKKASEAWLKKIESEKGVKKTESGLLYKVVEPGDMSVKPVALDNVVEVHYKGSTRKGVVFDASRYADMPAERQKMLKMYRPNDYDKDEPIKFPLNGVIKGWGEGLQLVGKGGKIVLWIPAELAYGERGAGQLIGPNEALRFDVELLDVEIPESAE